ncbi:helix-turn-helix domain-containing protein [Bacillus subtilis]
MVNKVREVRQEIGMSVSDLARKVNTSRQSITKIELHGQEPSGYMMLRIAHALNKDPREIFFEVDVTHGLQNGNENSA